LYRQLYGFAMSVALPFSRDQLDAKDILSHSFIKVFRSIKSYDSLKGTFHGWLKKIITNEALDHIKQRGRFSNVELEKADEPHIESAVVQRMDENVVMQMVQELPPATRAVFVLFVMEGYAHKEIGEKLNITEGTSKWHLSEARKLLQRKILNQKG
jgi:RNA polymerase sigma factor (sigma-70 family)